MHSTFARAVIGASLLAACGGNSTGSATTGNGFPSSPGADHGGGATPLNGNSGSDNPTNAGSDGTKPGAGTRSAPHTCSATSPCASPEVCSSQTHPGFCVEFCSLPQGVTSGPSTCPSPEECVRYESDIAVCLLPCTTSGDCPPVAGFEALCVGLGADAGGDHYCDWVQPATPGG